jgi:hypothetical protein
VLSLLVLTVPTARKGQRWSIKDKRCCPRIPRTIFSMSNDKDNVCNQHFWVFLRCVLRNRMQATEGCSCNPG